MSADPQGTPNPNPTPAPVTEEQINQRIEAARQEEKRKLYSEMEQLRQQVAALPQANEAKAELEQQLKDLKAQLAAFEKAKTDKGEIDTLALARQIADETRAIVSSQHQQEIAALNDKLARMEQEQKKQQLEALKKTLIAEANGRIVVALVQGNTEEELRRSAEEAKRTYEEIAQSSRQNPPQAPSQPPPPPPLNPRQAAGSGNPPASGVDGFKRSGDASTFGKNRQAVMADLKARFG